MDSVSQVWRRNVSLIRSESVIFKWSRVSAYQIIMGNKLWEYSACIYISPLLTRISLSLILFVSQCLANFALGCNFGSQENAPRLHNLASRATVVIQRQWAMPQGWVDSQSATVQIKRPLVPPPFKCNELFHCIAVQKGGPQEWVYMYDKYIVEVTQHWQ